MKLGADGADCPRSSGAAANYKAVWEEGDRRAVEMTLPASTSDIEYLHPSEVVYFVAGGKVKVHLEDGETIEAEFPDGFVLSPYAWTHRGENVGTIDIRATALVRAPARPCVPLRTHAGRTRPRRSRPGARRGSPRRAG